ncbi:hypothetical protein EV643_13372 [Kribbella sp. VKM Ac-2527]|uniref:DUF4386 family protein n=1 Tax=Kribbella caucasensis TaxID=2512215 RepID=A0A4R6JC02_9ACTN|nr:hypothetical protein [Kribbella sp. VKM Ac-2527]TDO33274.1 hypothetical protein EV643_13372 [Kribbella sp. VKM Ac-2527]
MKSASVPGEGLKSTGRGLARRAAAACGALFTLGIVIGDDTINRAGEPPVPMDRPDDSLAAVERYLASAAVAAADGNYWVGRGIGTLALIALLVFSVYVAQEIQLREGGSGLLSGICRGAGLVAVSLGLVSCTAQFAAVARASEGIDAGTARALLDLSALTFVLMWLPIATFMTSVALAGRRHALLTRWLTITTGVIAAALFAGLASMPAGSVGFFAIVLGFAWFIAVSVWMVRRAT